MRPPPTPEQLAAEQASINETLAAVEESRARMNKLTDAERAGLETRARQRISEGAQMVEKHRPEMNAMTPAERAHHLEIGMQMIYSRWWPIASAPKNGTHILLYRKSPASCVIEAWWRENVFKTAYEWGGSGWSYPDDDQPTHWMPLPAAP